MTPLPNHLDFEAMLRPRRPTEEAFFGTFEMWVVVSFSAKWCGPCQRLDKKGIVRATPNVHWYAVDVDENDTTLGYCGCRSIPAFVILRDGIFLDKKEGASSSQDVLNWLASKGVPVEM